MATGDTVRREAIFGAADGVVIALGLIVSLAGQRHALFHAGLGAGLAEFVGMSAGRWLSDSDDGIGVALANGTAALLACVIPVVPALAGTGPGVLGAELALVFLVAAAISWLRPERGVLAIVQTYGILAVAAGLCWLGGLA